MGWWFEDVEEVVDWFFYPVTALPVSVYHLAGYLADDDSVPSPDWQANIRNSMMWGGMAIGVHGWNAYFHPGKYSFRTISDLVKLVGHIGGTSSAAVPAALAAVAVGSAVGWAATAEHHGAVPPGIGMGMPMTQPPSSATSSNPAGWDIQTWWDEL